MNPLNIFKNPESFAYAVILAAIFGGGLYCAHLKRLLAEERDERQAMAAQAAMCREAVTQLEAQAKERDAAAKKALADAQAQADKHARRADALLRKPAAVPGDDCASARVRAREWLEARR